MYFQREDQGSPWRSLLSLSSDLEKQFLREETADVKFRLGDYVIPAHQWILAARVPYFKRLFASGMREAATKEITIEDFDAKPFGGMLRFIYCGKLPDDSSADSILPLADKYGIPELKEVCTFALKKTLSKENAIKTLCLADLHQCPELRSYCISRLSEWNRPQWYG